MPPKPSHVQNNKRATRSRCSTRPLLHSTPTYFSSLAAIWLLPHDCVFTMLALTIRSVLDASRKVGPPLRTNRPPSYPSLKLVTSSVITVSPCYRHYLCATAPSLVYVEITFIVNIDAMINTLHISTGPHYHHHSFVVCTAP
jgi:hypothetical protein